MRRARYVTRGPARQRRWPWAPLAAMVGGDTVTETARRLDVNTNAVYRWVHDGIPETMADRLAVRHGVHPSLVWPDWFDVALNDGGVAA